MRLSFTYPYNFPLTDFGRDALESLILSALAGDYFDAERFGYAVKQADSTADVNSDRYTPFYALDNISFSRYPQGTYANLLKELGVFLGGITIVAEDTINTDQTPQATITYPAEFKLNGFQRDVFELLVITMFDDDQFDLYQLEMADLLLNPGRGKGAGSLKKFAQLSDIKLVDLKPGFQDNLLREIGLTLGGIKIDLAPEESNELRGIRLIKPIHSSGNSNLKTMSKIACALVFLGGALVMQQMNENSKDDSTPYVITATSNDSLPEMIVYADDTESTKPNNSTDTYVKPSTNIVSEATTETPKAAIESAHSTDSLAEPATEAIVKNEVIAVKTLDAITKSAEIITALPAKPIDTTHSLPVKKINKTAISQSKKNHHDQAMLSNKKIRKALPDAIKPIKKDSLRKKDKTTTTNALADHKRDKKIN